jgi:20S proteasome alpha/beta subunit
MTYISAFHCERGIILCADSQETVGDQKRDAEKLYVAETYPLAVGGAGLDEAIDAFAQELISKVESERPTTIPDLRTIVQAALKENHEKDAASSEWPAEYRKAQYLIAARPNHDKRVLLRVKGKRIYQVKQHAIIGYATAANLSLLKRMHRADLPMQQAVMLAIYLVSQSKAIDEGVSGEPRVAIVDDDIAWLDYPDYLAASEAHIAKFIKLIDNLFLLCVDGSIPPSKFPEVLSAFGKDVTCLRDKYIHESAAITFSHAFNDADYRGEPYPKIFEGAATHFGREGIIGVTEQSAEEKEEFRKMRSYALDQGRMFQTAQEFHRLTHGKTFTYVTEGEMSGQGSASTE